jgi:hypothetical protein
MLQGKRVIEIGSGAAGIPGIVAARIGAIAVTLTECYPRLLIALRRNVDLNVDVTNVGVEHLDWTEPLLPHRIGSADVVLGSEVIWKGCDPMPLVTTIHNLLVPRSGRAFIILPDGGRGAEEHFLSAAASIGLYCESIRIGKLLDSGKVASNDEAGDDDVFYVHVFRIGS